MHIPQYPQLNQYLQFLQFEKKYSGHTLMAYETDLLQFFNYLILVYEAPPLSEIKPAFVRSWLAEAKSKDELTNKSINRKISALKSFFKYMLKMGILEQSPAAGIISPKISRRLPVFVDEKDIADLFAHTEFSDDHTGKTEKLILSLFYNTGMRLSELIQLKESNIDYAYNTIKVLGKGNKERLIPISTQLVTQIEEYASQKLNSALSEGRLFITEKGKPYQPKTVYNMVKKYLSTATTIEKKSPHILRHSFATHLMNNGAEMNAVKELLGHSSLASTQVYTHLTIEKLKEVYKQAHPKA